MKQKLLKRKIEIYKVTSPVGKIYIGQSTHIKSRFKGYKVLHCKRQFKLYNSLIKYGVENHVFEIIEECEKGKLDELEIYYINVYNSFNSDFGLNLMSGGKSNYRVSDFTKHKISNILTGRKHTQQTKDKIRIKLTGNKNSQGNTHSIETRLKMTESQKGNKCGVFNKGKKRTEKQKKEKSESMKKKTILRNEKGQIIKTVNKVPFMIEETLKELHQI